jgi:phosphate transport system substrate-binding protein
MRDRIKLRNLLTTISLAMAVMLMASCNNGKIKTQTDTPQQGTIDISVDESFEPVIEEEIKVYESTYPNAHIIAHYKPEIECFKDLEKDSTRLIIVARGLERKERDYYESVIGYRPQYALIAYDAVAIIVNQKCKDSVFTIKRLHDILSGKENLTAVMDGKNATSTVLYLKDSILKGEQFGKNVVASKSSDDVINIITNRADAIGFVGLNWVGDNYDRKQQELLKKIKLGLVECVRCEEKGLFARPSAASVSFAQYPLARPLYFILKENATGLGTGFTDFLSMERGQLIFRRAFLIPAILNFNKRTTKIEE